MIAEAFAVAARLHASAMEPGLAELRRQAQEVQSSSRLAGLSLFTEAVKARHRASQAVASVSEEGQRQLNDAIMALATAAKEPSTSDVDIVEEQFDMQSLVEAGGEVLDAAEAVREHRADKETASPPPDDDAPGRWNVQNVAAVLYIAHTVWGIAQGLPVGELRDALIRYAVLLMAWAQQVAK